MLTETERILFRRLAVFLGGFDLDAAQAVAGDAEVERYQILDQLALLVDKSLVVAENTSGRTRYRLLETVRQYAQEKLGESGEAEAVRSRHRDHYTAMAALLDAPARTDTPARRAGGRARWTICEAHSGGASKPATSSAHWSWRRRCSRCGCRAAASRKGWPGSMPRSPSRKTLTRWRLHVRARVLADKAVLDCWVNNYNAERAEEALAIARELDDPALLVRALTACGSAAVYDTEAALRYFAEAIGLARALGDQWRMTQILGQQAHAAFVSGDTVALAPPPRKAVRSPTPSATVSDRASVGGGWRAHAFQGDLAGAIALLRDWSPRPKPTTT